MLEPAELADIQEYWEHTAGARARVRATLSELGITDLELSRFYPDLDSVARPWLSRAGEDAATAELLQAMGSIANPESEGFFLLDVGRILAKEAALIAAFERELEGLAFRQMAAFKANHSLLLHYARRRASSCAGIEVASLPELIAACCLGFEPDQIVFFSPAITEREFVVAHHLGVRAFCVDHCAKLARLLDACARHQLDTASLKVLARIAAPYAAAGLNMTRFGLDVVKNPEQTTGLLDLLRAAGTSLAGVSFHIGIGGRSLRGYEAVFDAIEGLFRLCEARGEALPRIIDVGGGFAFNDAAHRYQAATTFEEQVAAIGRGIRRLRAGFEIELEVWSESGQGYLGDGGATFVPVDFHEQRECPSRSLQVVSPHAPGQFAWFQHGKSIFATREQWLVSRAGFWSFGTSRYTTIQPELWAIDARGHGARVEVPEEALIPTLVFGKTCDPCDALNPRVEGEFLRVLMPELARLARADPQQRFVLRLPFASYVDTSGDFNWQTTRLLPWRYVLGTPPAAVSVPSEPLATTRASVGEARAPLEYRDRLFARGVLSATQLEQAKTLIAEQFAAREQMCAWLRDSGQLDPRELETLPHLFRVQAGLCIEDGLSMVRLELPPGAPDRAGEVVGAIAVKRFAAADAPSLPLALIDDHDCRTTRLMFEIEARVMRQIVRLDGGLREKMLPMAYLAMSAKAPGRGPSIRSLRRKIVDLASGAAGIKSLCSLTTGARSSAVAAAMPGSFVMMRIPYGRVHFHGRRPFEGLRFGEQPGELRVHMHDLRGPERFVEPLPRGLEFGLEIGDSGRLDPVA